MTQPSLALVDCTSDPSLSVAPSVSSLAGRVSRSFRAIVLPDLLEELALERCPRASGARATRGQSSVPRAIVLAEDRSTGLEPTTRLDAVNGAAHRLGVSPRQTIAQATAM